MQSERIHALIKIGCLVYLIIFLPRALGIFEQTPQKEQPQNCTLGVCNLIESYELAGTHKHKEFGLIMSDDPCDEEFNRSGELLVRSGWNIKNIIQLPSSLPQSVLTDMFHGGLLAPGSIPPVLRLTDLEGPAWDRFINSVDDILVDIQPTGMRWDNALSRLITILQEAASSNKRVLVLDRPNPLGGKIEGPGTVPLRYGLTIGELALYVNKYICKKPAELTVIPMVGWKRFKTNKGHELLDPQVLALYYAHSLLVPFKEMAPFSVIFNQERKLYLLLWPENNGLTEWEAKYLSHEKGGLCIKLGLVVQPYTHKDAEGKKLKGLRILGVKKIDRFSLMSSYLTLVRFFGSRPKSLPITFSDRFDFLMGTEEVRKFFQGKITFDILKALVEKELFAFYEKAKECCLYSPDPTISTLYLRKGIREQ